MGFNLTKCATTGSRESSASQNLLPDRNGDQVKRSGEKLCGFRDNRCRGESRCLKPAAEIRITTLVLKSSGLMGGHPVYSHRAMWR